MINNRQSSSRRRGRGGSNQRTSGGGSGQRDSGNRIDSRARGNAAQLLEKYKNMARDAQMQGDRVNTEYYLQFADHYFRVLSDGRARSDDQRPQAQTNGFDGFDSNGDEEYGDEGEPIRANEMTPRDDGRRDDGNRDNNARRDDGRRDDGRNDPQRRDYAPRDDYRRDTQGRGDQNRDSQARYGNQAPVRDDGREESRPAQATSNGHAAYRNGTANEEREAAPEAAAKPERRPSRSRSKPAAPANEDSPAFDAALLPPSLNVATDEATEEKPKRRRGRPPASEATQPN